MSLKVAIVGLPNVGKSTLFNALLKKQQALAANYPFATIEPNVGVVAIPDERLVQLAVTVARGRDGAVSINLGSKEGAPVAVNPDVGNERLDYTKLPPTVPATIEFYDVAGLVKDAHKGEGLGNKFLAHIRECDAVAYVVRAFSDSNVVETGSGDFGDDLLTVKTELMMKDLETVEMQHAKIKSQHDNSKIKIILEKLARGINTGQLASEVLDVDETEAVRELCLLTTKPQIYVVNASEGDVVGRIEELRIEFAKRLGVRMKDLVVVSAKVEAELALLSDEEQKMYLADLGLEESGIGRMAKVAYDKLNLQSFLTAGEKEVRAWTVRAGFSAVEAAGVIHTDFMKKFIKADVIGWEDFVTIGGWKRARELGRVRQEGRDYLMQDGDVVDFRIGS